MRVMITGANGYVGSSLLRQLSGGYDVVGITRKECILTDADSVEAYFAEQQPFDFVVHCAVTGGVRGVHDEAVVTHNNLLMFSNLMHWKGRAFESVINIGSGAEYDRRGRIHPDVQQVRKGVPIDPYGMSKFYINRFIQTESDAYNLRIFAVFDEHESDRRMIKTALKNYVNEEPVRLVNNGDLEMDFIYMDDFVYMIRQVLSGNVPRDLKEADCVYKTYDFPPGFENSKSMRDLVEFHIGSLDPDKRVRIEDASDLAASFTEAYVGTPPEWIDHNALVGLKEGIRRTYEKLKQDEQG